MFFKSYDSDPIHTNRAIQVPPFGENPVADILLDEVESLNFELLDQREATQYRIIQLEKDLKTETGNRDHFRTIGVQQDAYIKELKVQIEQWKVEKNKETDAVRAELKTKTEETNHLARKAVELNQQVATLTEEHNSLFEVYCKLCEKSQDLECAGCRTGAMSAYCDRCLRCQVRQAKHTINRLKDRLTYAHKTNDARYEITNLYNQMHGIFTKYLETQAKRWFGRAAAKAVLARTAALSTKINMIFDKMLNRQLDPFVGTEAKTEVCGCTSEKCDNMTVTTTSSELKSPLPMNKDADYEIPSQPKA